MGSIVFIQAVRVMLHAGFRLRTHHQASRRGPLDRRGARTNLRVLIIGAGGFVGRVLSARLAQRPSVIEALTLVDQQDFTVPVGAEVPIFKRIGNFAEPKFCQSILEGVQAVLVLAAVLGGTAEAHYSLARRINIDATLSLFELLRKASDPPRVVFA